MGCSEQVLLLTLHTQLAELGLKTRRHPSVGDDAEGPA